MTDPSPSKQPSKNLEAMKFMQRKKEADLRAKLQEEQAQELKKSQWVVGGNSEDINATVAISGVSEVFTKITTSTGRKSFGKFNPAIDKLEKEVAEDNKKAMKEWNQHQSTTEVEKNDDNKKGNNIKWIKKVQGSGGVDGRMDKGTVTATEMAERFLTMVKDDIGEPKESNRQKKKNKKLQQKAKAEAKGESGDSSDSEDEKSKGSSSDGDKSESSDSGESEHSSQDSESEKETKAPPPTKQTKTPPKQTRKSNNNKDAKQKQTANVPQNNKDNKKNTDKPNNNNQQNSNNKPNNNKQNNNNQQNNKNNNNKDQNKRKQQPTEANVAALEKQFKKPKV